MFHAIPYAEEFAIQKRALDVAMKGYSDLKQPKRKTGSVSVRTTSFKSNAKSGLQLISKTREEQKLILERLDESIHTEVLLIRSILAEHGDGNVDSIQDPKRTQVCNVMRSIKLHQKEYVRVLRVIEGIKVIEIGMQDGFLDPRKVAKCLNEIQKVLWKARAHSDAQKVVASDDKLLSQVKKEEYYPYLKSKHPGKVFFKSTKPKNAAELEHEHLLIKARSSSSSFTDGSSMPALSSICSESVVTASVFGDSTYAASEVSSAPNSPTLGSTRNFFPGGGFIDLDISIDSRDILIPALALQHPETIILDVLSPSLDNIAPKERPSRWDDLSRSDRSNRSGSPKPFTITVDTAPSHPRSPLRSRDSLPSRPPSRVQRSDSFIGVDAEPNLGMDAILSDSSSLDCIPRLPPRRSSGDSTIQEQKERV